MAPEESPARCGCFPGALGAGEVRDNFCHGLPIAEGAGSGGQGRTSADGRAAGDGNRPVGKCHVRASLGCDLGGDASRAPGWRRGHAEEGQRRAGERQDGAADRPEGDRAAATRRSRPFQGGEGQEGRRNEGACHLHRGGERRGREHGPGKVRGLRGEGGALEGRHRHEDGDRSTEGHGEGIGSRRKAGVYPGSWGSKA